MLPTHGAEVNAPIELYAYTDSWADDDPHANFKAAVATYSVADPLPTLQNLSRATGIPLPALIRYVLVKYAASGAEALLSMTPIVLQQMEEHIQLAEAANSDAARLAAYAALRQMVTWLKLGIMET
jgi:hypothetical protein